MSLFGLTDDSPMIFTNRDVLRDSYRPDHIVGREREKEELHKSLRCLWRGTGTPDNVFISGPSGTGKTVTVRSAMEQVTADEDLNVHVSWLNCESVNGATPLMIKVANTFRERSDWFNTTGYSEAQAMDLMFNEFDNADADSVLVVLDELDSVTNGLDKVLYHIPRSHEHTDTPVSLFSISNKPDYIHELPSETLSSLNDRHISFSEYDANELREVLNSRAAMAFKDTELDESGNVDSSVLSAEVIPFASAMAAKSGDARMARDVLLDAGELAVDDGSDMVARDHAEQAVNRYHRSRMVQTIRDWTDTAKLTLYALITLDAGGREHARTSEVYQRYEHLATNAGRSAVTKRQVENVLKRFNTSGLTELSKHHGSGGRYDSHTLNYDGAALVEAIRDVVDVAGVHRSVVHYFDDVDAAAVTETAD